MEDERCARWYPSVVFWKKIAYEEKCDSCDKELDNKEAWEEDTGDRPPNSFYCKECFSALDSLKEEAGVIFQVFPRNKCTEIHKESSVLDSFYQLKNFKDDQSCQVCNLVKLNREIAANNRY